MTLSSDTQFYKEVNTRSVFRNKLSETIRLKKEEWEVALTEAIIPNEYKNILEGKNEFFFMTFNQTLQIGRAHV